MQYCVEFTCEQNDSECESARSHLKFNETHGQQRIGFEERDVQEARDETAKLTAARLEWKKIAKSM